MVNTFLRPPDLKHLKNKHVEVVKTKKTQYLRIRALSKVGPSPVISMEAGVGIYEKLLELHGDLAGPEDFVFFPALKNRQFAFETLRRQFNHVLDKAGLKHSATNASACSRVRKNSTTPPRLTTP